MQQAHNGHQNNDIDLTNLLVGNSYEDLNLWLRLPDSTWRTNGRKATPTKSQQQTLYMTKNYWEIPSNDALNDTLNYLMQDAQDSCQNGDGNKRVDSKDVTKSHQKNYHRIQYEENQFVTAN